MGPLATTVQYHRCQLVCSSQSQKQSIQSSTYTQTNKCLLEQILQPGITVQQSNITGVSWYAAAVPEAIDTSTYTQTNKCLLEQILQPGPRSCVHVEGKGGGREVRSTKDLSVLVLPSSNSEMANNYKIIPATQVKLQLSVINGAQNIQFSNTHDSLTSPHVAFEKPKCIL